MELEIRIKPLYITELALLRSIILLASGPRNKAATDDDSLYIRSRAYQSDNPDDM
jgi:hypothetical protein